MALRVPCAVRRLRRWRKLATLKQCAAVFPESPALLGHAKGQKKDGQTIVEETLMSRFSLKTVGEKFGGWNT